MCNGGMLTKRKMKHYNSVPMFAEGKPLPSTGPYGAQYSPVTPAPDSANSTDLGQGSRAVFAFPPNDNLLQDSMLNRLPGSGAVAPGPPLPMPFETPSHFNTTAGFQNKTLPNGLSQYQGVEVFRRPSVSLSSITDSFRSDISDPIFSQGQFNYQTNSSQAWSPPFPTRTWSQQEHSFVHMDRESSPRNQPKSNLLLFTITPLL
ncbi:hypothetical protein Ciccas_000868 [Cichlidogyrus casuarinus]|uniref:Uncharacterized protein n=1 Tax=Cichlidogyrus casuarinus TaxID=1844966 RepID=A0ABD2QLN3_9PLAT